MLSMWDWSAKNGPPVRRTAYARNGPDRPQARRWPFESSGAESEEIAAGCRQILGDAASWLFRPVRSPQSSSLWTQAYVGLRRRRDSGRCGGCEINRFSAFNSASRRLERLSLGAMEYTLRRKGILLNRCRRPCGGVDFSKFAVSQPLSDILATPVVSEDSLAVARSWGSTYHFR